jgi:hypothetical protein
MSSGDSVVPPGEDLAAGDPKNLFFSQKGAAEKVSPIFRTWRHHSAWLEAQLEKIKSYLILYTIFLQ